MIPFHRRHEAALARADACAGAADAVALALWRQILRALAGPGSPWERAQAVRRLWAALPHLAAARTSHALAAAARMAWHQAADDAARRLPLAHLRAAAARRVFAGRLVPAGPVLEDEGSPADATPGLVRLALRSFGLQAFDPAGPLRDPGDMSPQEQRELFAALLFPAPSEAEIQRLVGGDWAARLQGATRFATGEALAAVLLPGLAAGKTQRELAAELAPAVNNVRASARRIARTEGLRVAGAADLAAFEQLGPDLVVGYKVRASLDRNTRPEHRARDGTEYYRDPKPGQKGFGQMPRPPLEADGTVAWNCRCWLSPILAPIGKTESKTT